MDNQLSPITILSVGATGSIGRLVVAEAMRQGHAVRALVRNKSRAQRLPEGVEIVVGDVTQPETLVAAVERVSAVVFTLGSEGKGKVGAEAVDYGGVRNVLAALRPRNVRIALMTAIGVTNRTGSYNRTTEAHDWKRRAERLVRASGLTYTIVRPGWFDYNGADEQLPMLLQGDKRQTGTPDDGAIARSQIAEILVSSLTSSSAACKTFELVSAAGSAPDSLDPLLAKLEPDLAGEVDGVHDSPNMPLLDEPRRVLDDLNVVQANRVTDD